MIRNTAPLYWEITQTTAKRWPLKWTAPFAAIVSVGLWVGGLVGVQELLKLG